MAMPLLQVWQCCLHTCLTWLPSLVCPPVACDSYTAQDRCGFSTFSLFCPCQYIVSVTREKKLHTYFHRALDCPRYPSLLSDSRPRKPISQYSTVDLFFLSSGTYSVLFPRKPELIFCLALPGLRTHFSSVLHSPHAVGLWVERCPGWQCPKMTDKKWSGCKMRWEYREVPGTS